MASEGERQTDQAEVIAFLSDPASWSTRPARVDTVETHGALVFLAGDGALKIKRAVRLAYLDFSTLERREAYCRREIEINRPNAPEIYRGVVAITRGADGSLAIGGTGEPVEWAVVMARFPESDVLSSIAETQGIGDELAADLAATVLAAHGRAAPQVPAEHAAHLARIVASVAESLDRPAADIADGRAQVARFRSLAEARLARVAGLLAERADAKLVRRCHGDMHLGNIVLWKGRPVLFDAIEFDEALATIDVLYDLAFLLMDLDRRGQRRAAHVVLDRYLAGSGRDLDIAGLAALPLFIGLRAAVRAMVAFDRAHIQSWEVRAATEAHARQTLDLALGYLAPPPPRLVAVGGLSGTGKTTLAAALAPAIGPVPGALHLRSDVVRKQLAGVGELERLPPSAYTPAASAAVYTRLAARAAIALGAGHSVVIDAVLDRASERARLEKVAADAGVRFDGLWLEAPPEAMKARVAARAGDASDATPEIVERQLAALSGPIEWHRLAASAERGDVAAAARSLLGLAAG
ncbi:MAG: AAA family ATPase [Hyphomicrobiaceae bacterium]